MRAGLRMATGTAGILSALLASALAAPPAQAQPATVCAQVKIEILQRLTFERVAFDARMVITNNLTTEPLTGLGVALNITTLDGQDANHLFFIRVNGLTNISGVDGTGSIDPGARAEAHWLIIPSARAGGGGPARGLASRARAPRRPGSPPRPPARAGRSRWARPTW